MACTGISPIYSSSTCDKSSWIVSSVRINMNRIGWLIAGVLVFYLVLISDGQMEKGAVVAAYEKCEVCIDRCIKNNCTSYNYEYSDEYLLCEWDCHDWCWHTVRCELKHPHDPCVVRMEQCFTNCASNDNYDSCVDKCYSYKETCMVMAATE